MFHKRQHLKRIQQRGDDREAALTNEKRDRWIKLLNFLKENEIPVKIILDGELLFTEDGIIKEIDTTTFRARILVHGITGKGGSFPLIALQEISILW